MPAPLSSCKRYKGELFYEKSEVSMATNAEVVPNVDLEQVLPAMFSTRLKALAERQGISMEDALAQAIRLDEVILDAKNDNGEVLVVKGGQKYAINFR